MCAGRRRCESHEVAWADFERFVADLGDTAALEHVEEFFVCVVEVELRALASRLQSNHVDADALHADARAERTREAHRVVVELMLAAHGLDRLDRGGVQQRLRSIVLAH